MHEPVHRLATSSNNDVEAGCQLPLCLATLFGLKLATEQQWVMTKAAFNSWQP